MKLTHNCPKCGRPAQIQAEFPLGKLIHYVYRCGHVELRSKINVANEVSEELNILLDKKTIEQKVGSTKQQNSINSQSEHKSPNVQQNKNQVYDELDRWVTDGGKTKGINEEWIQNLKPAYYYDPSFSSTDLDAHSFDFQIEGIRFVENTQLNCLIADAMGLGKTIQALIALKRNKQIAIPAIIVVKGSTIFQWAREITKWYNKEFSSCMPVTSRLQLMLGFELYIISMDMLGKDDFVNKLVELRPRTVIIDEVQNFKDPNAKRTEGLIKLIKLAKVKYKIALSGTPIKNRVTEYGPILNILAPTYFPNSTLEAKWLKPETKINANGRPITVYRRLNPLYADQFFELTSKFIIRREKHEVLRNLPDLTRDYQIIEIDDKNIKQTYNRAIGLFANFLKDNKSEIKSTQILGWLQQLRAITGQAKCKNAIEWTNDILESTDESLAIGIHHHSVRDTLYGVLNNAGIKVLKLSGEDNVYRKNDIVRSFTNGDVRVLVINSLAGGVGLNLQSCAQALVLERQWNSADEEQFECRFHRNGQQKAVTVTYMIAKGTIDEFFHNMVEEKRKILIETGIGQTWDMSNDLESLLQFAEMVASYKI